MTSDPITSASHPQPRSRIQKLSDLALGRMIGLPRATSDYTVARAVPVPMRDGVDLIGDHYAPASAPRGTLLARGPYGRSLPYSQAFARVYAERGYHVFLQSCRGTFGSGGTFEPMVHEADDGADTVAWLREQPWFTGSFATVGLSYLGFTQWALLSDPPPELKASVILVGPHDFSRAAYGTGAFALNDFLGWSDMVARQEKLSPLGRAVDLMGGGKRLVRALGTVPLVDADAELLEGDAPWYREWITHTDPSDSYWEPYQLGGALDRAQAPVLLIGGWQDLFLEQTLEQYTRLRGRGVDVALTVGPWTHLESLMKGAGVVVRESLDWLAEHLAGDAVRQRPAPVRVFVTGGGGWRELPHWPPRADTEVLYLQPGRGLDSGPSTVDAAASTFTYDPADPTPSVGGRLLSSVGGYRDNRRLEARSDVLVFTGPALTDGLEVIGVPVVELAHWSDNPNCDVFVRLCEVDGRGRSTNVSDGFVRLFPDSTEPVVHLELDAVAHRFRPGSRIRLQVSGGSHPRFDRNLGTGEPPATSTRMARSQRTVFHGASSRVILPRVGPSRNCGSQAQR